MAVLTRDTQDLYVAKRPYRAGICLVDTSSAVRNIPTKSFLRGIGRDSETPRHVLLSDGAGVRQMLG
jgi:hypothetical protein